jgi:transposase
MSEPACLGCRERDVIIAGLLQRVTQLEQQVRDLEDRLGRNASNSSLPPSANPPAAPKPTAKKPTGKRPGGQPGHRGHSRLALPADRLSHVIPLAPTHCDHCRAPLPAQPSPGDPEPTRHQFAELPRLACVVTEFQGQARTCRCCGAVTWAAIPAQIRAHAFGPRLAAALAYLAGCQHVSKRGLEEVAQTLFGVPVSLGTIAALEQQMSAALAEPYQEAAAAARRAEVKNVDETGWKQAGGRRWLWVAVSAAAVCFLIHRRRGAAALRALLGEEPAGVIGSDRWSAYQVVPLGRRQVCWAHLRRDFQAMIDRGGAAAEVGEALLFHADILFDLWYKVRDGTRRRRWLERHVDEWLRAEVIDWLRRGEICGCAKTAGVCAEILKVEGALWTFARVGGVEPTNNAAERALRPAVLWRKRSFGCHSEAGCRFVERLLSVVQTLRLRGQAVLSYLAEAVSAHRHNLPAPQLLPAD